MSLRWVLAGVACAVVAVGAALAVIDDAAEGHLRWKLVSVSADARTIGVLHDQPHCQTRAGRATVRESSSAVHISIEQVEKDLPADGACLGDLRLGVSRVRLQRALGAKRLTQPVDGRGGRELGFSMPQWQRICPRQLALPSQAPARKVPWVQRRLRFCQESIPASVRALPILRRKPSSADRLSPSVLRELAPQPFIVERSLARGLKRPAPMWLVPGPRTSCLFVRFRQSEAPRNECDATQTVARRGLYVADFCANRKRPRHLSTAGIVPAGVRAIEIRRHGRVIKRAAVRSGAWRARTLYPTSISYGAVRLSVPQPSGGC